MKKYLTLIAAATLMAACSNETEVPADNQPGQAIAVTVDQECLTRATGEISTPSKLAQTGFGLFGCYTGRQTYENTSVSADFMYNQKVTSDDEGVNWVYNPLKYWPNSTDVQTGEKYTEYVSFFAYAPYEATPKDDGRCIFGMSDKYEMGDPWVNYRLSEDPWGETNPQVDLMYGIKYKRVRGHELGDDLFYDQTKPDINDKMKFYFEHALSCIGDKITIQLSKELDEYIHGDETSATGKYADIIVSDINIEYENLTTKARLVLNSPSGPNWKEIISGELTTTRTLKLSPMAELTAEPKEVSTGQGLFYIPLLVKGCEPAKAVITVSYTVRNNNGTMYSGKTSTSFFLSMLTDGEKEGIALILGKDLDLLHLTYPIDGTKRATEPSYSRELK